MLSESCIRRVYHSGKDISEFWGNSPFYYFLALLQFLLEFFILLFA